MERTPATVVRGRPRQGLHPQKSVWEGSLCRQSWSQRVRSVLAFWGFYPESQGR